MPTYEYSRIAIRELLLAAFTAKDLQRFCEYRPALRRVVHCFPQNASLMDMADEVLGYCERFVLLDDLLTEIADYNPPQFERFRDRIFGHQPLGIKENRLRPSPEETRHLEDARLEVVRAACARVLEALEHTPFADHGAAHAERVHGHLQQLLDGSCRENLHLLSEEERFVVQAAALLHNVGLVLADAAESAYLRQIFQRHDWPESGTDGWETMLATHYHELSAEMILGSVEDPAQYPTLGLGPGDPVAAIAQVVRMHARPDLAGPETIPWSGKPLRVRMLAALVRLAASLDIGVVLGPPKAAPEARLYDWLRSYIRSISISGPGACIQVEYWLPSEAYIAPVEALVYDVLLRRYAEVRPILWNHGCFVRLATPVLRYPALVPPLPEDLVQQMANPAELRRILARQTRVLGAGSAEIPRLSPYPFGAVREVPAFAWEVEPDLAGCTFQVVLTDLQTYGMYGPVEAPAGSNRISYPASWPQLIPGSRYQWGIRIQREGRTIERVQGIFWLLTPAEFQVVGREEQKLDSDDHLGRGFFALQAGLYGEADVHFQQALEGKPSVSILARRALAQMYEEIAAELAQSGKPDQAYPFARAADEHYKILREVILAGLRGNAGG